MNLTFYAVETIVGIHFVVVVRAIIVGAIIVGAIHCRGNS